MRSCAILFVSPAMPVPFRRLPPLRFPALRRVLRRTVPISAAIVCLTIGACLMAGCGLVDTTGDTRAPLVVLDRPTDSMALLAPAAGEVLVRVLVTPRGEDNGVSEVGVLLNNERVATATVVGTPVKNTAGFFVYTYTARIDAGALPDGDYRLEAVAFDRFGARGTTPPVRFRVANGSALSGPSARITEPLDGASVKGSVRVVVTPSGPDPLSRVDFLVDGLTASVDSVAPFEWVWPTRRDGLGPHTLQARAYDGGAVALTNAVRVTVTDTTSTTPIDPTPTPTVDPNCSVAGCKRFVANAPSAILAPLAADASGNVYGVTTGSQVVAWSSTGAVRWTKTLPAPVRVAPLIGADGSVYVADEAGRVSAFSPAGVSLWTYDAAGSVGGLALSGTGQVLFGDTRGRLHAVGIVSGQPASGFPATVSSAAITTPVAVLRSGDIAVTSSDGLVYLMGSNGLRRWVSRENFGTFSFGPVLGEVGSIGNAATTVYVVNSGGRMVTLAGSDGAVLWSVILENMPRAAPIVGNDGTVFALTASGLSAYSETAPTGQSRLRWTFGAPNAAAPSLDGSGRVLLPTGADVALLDPVTGAALSRFPSGASVQPGLVSPLGTFYAAVGPTVTGLYSGAAGPALGRWPMVGRNARRTHRADDGP